MRAPFVVRAACFILLACLLGSLLVPTARGQDSVRTITFNEAVQLALSQNVSLKQQANAAELQRLGVSRARAQFLPDLRLNTQGQQSYGRTFIESEAITTNQTSESFRGNVSSSVNLFNGFGDVASLQQARRQAEASDLNYERRRQDVVFDVMSEFLTLVRQREQVQVRQENLEARRQQLQQIREFVEVGTRPRSDLYQQEAEVAQADLDLLNARQQYTLTQVNLIETLQLDPFGDYAFQAPAVEDSVTAPPTYQLDRLLRTAYNQRPDLQANRLEIDAAQQGIRVARSSYWPSVGLSAGYGSNYNSAVPFSFQDQFTDLNRGGSVGLSLSFPLFDRFQTRNSIQEARVRRENAQYALQDQRHEIALQVRRAYQDYQTARRRLDVTRKQVRAARQSLRAAQERYELGAGTIVELSQARSRYVQAQSDRVEAKYEFFFQQKLLNYYTGELAPSRSLLE